MIVHWCRKRVYHQHYLYIYVYVHVDTSILMLIYIVFTTNNIFQPFVLWNQKTIKYDFQSHFLFGKKCVEGTRSHAHTSTLNIDFVTISVLLFTVCWFVYWVCQTSTETITKTNFEIRVLFYYSMPYFYILPWGIILLPNHRFMTLTAFIVINFIFLFIP